MSETGFIILTTQAAAIAINTISCVGNPVLASILLFVKKPFIIKIRETTKHTGIKNEVKSPIVLVKKKQATIIIAVMI